MNLTLKELNLDNVQNNLLDQIKVVYKGQIFPIWVESQVCIFVKTGNSFSFLNVLTLRLFILNK